jgi:hypothetical protein
MTYINIRFDKYQVGNQYKGHRKQHKEFESKVASNLQNVY